VRAHLVGNADLTLAGISTWAGSQQLMALSLVPLAVGAGHLAVVFPGRLPGVAVFGAGMLAGALTVALAWWIRPRGPDRGDGHSPAAVAAAPVAVAVAVLAGRPARPLRSVVPLAQAGPADPAPAPSLRIGVLGSLTINGQAGALVPAQSQLIVALALNRDGLSNQQLRVLLGADSGHPKPADSLRQLIARTRRALGRAGDGREWIEHLGHGQYALHAEARVDWHEFETLTGTAGAAQLTEALNMIRGQPFTGCYYWWLEPAMVEAVTARIVAAAETLAELSLAGRDPAAAVRAARIGLAADASAEQLWRVMMRAEHAAGNLAGVREAWGRCLGVVSEVAADGQPDSATSAVYDELLAR
jgi:DNA-binding SARP family transcriptional activator